MDLPQILQHCIFRSTVSIEKTALTKLLENTLDENSKLKNMSNKKLGCLTKLLLRDFERTMPDLLKTLILKHGQT